MDESTTVTYHSRSMAVWLVGGPSLALYQVSLCLYNIMIFTTILHNSSVTLGGRACPTNSVFSRFVKLLTFLKLILLSTSVFVT